MYVPITCNILGRIEAQPASKWMHYGSGNCILHFAEQKYFKEAKQNIFLSEIEGFCYELILMNDRTKMCKALVIEMLNLCPGRSKA